MTPIAGVPIKHFDDAKQRLSSRLDSSRRSRLVMSVAAHTLGELSGAGFSPLVVAGSAEVAAWAERLGVDAIPDSGRGLDGAARAVVSHARSLDRPWVVVPGDLPLLRSSDLFEAARALVSGRPVIAPAHDGGTNLIGSPSFDLVFAYGPGSFHRHLGRLAAERPLVVATLGLLLDLDAPADLDACLRHPRGAWIERDTAIRSAS